MEKLKKQMTKVQLNPRSYGSTQQILKYDFYVREHDNDHSFTTKTTKEEEVNYINSSRGQITTIITRDQIKLKMNIKVGDKKEDHQVGKLHNCLIKGNNLNNNTKYLKQRMHELNLFRYQPPIKRI